MRERRTASGLVATTMVAVFVVARGFGCGSDGGPAPAKTTSLEPSSAPATDRPPPVRGDIVVTGVDPTTQVLRVAGHLGHTLVLQPDARIRVQGAEEGPVGLAVDELEAWLARRRAELGSTAPGVTMHYEGGLVDGTAEVTELIEVPPG